MAEIEFDDVVKRYPDGFEAVKHMNLEIMDGEVPSRDQPPDKRRRWGRRG